MVKNYAESTIIGNLLEKLAKQSRNGFYEFNTTCNNTLCNNSGKAIIYDNTNNKVVHAFMIDDDGLHRTLMAYTEEMVTLPKDRSIEVTVQHDESNTPYINVTINHLDTGEKSVATIKEGLWKFEEQ